MGQSFVSGGGDTRWIVVEELAHVTTIGDILIQSTYLGAWDISFYDCQQLNILRASGSSLLAGAGLGVSQQMALPSCKGKEELRS